MNTPNIEFEILQFDDNKLRQTVDVLKDGFLPWVSRDIEYLENIISFQSPRCQVVIALLENLVVGTVALYSRSRESERILPHKFRESPLLRNCAVRLEHRGRGIMPKLLDYSSAIALATHPLVVAEVTLDNDPSFRAFTKSGFVAEGMTVDEKSRVMVKRRLHC